MFRSLKKTTLPPFVLPVLALRRIASAFDHALGLRYFGILMGLLMVVSGNALPKLSQPHTAGAARAAERLAGWLFVLGGLAIVALWIWWAQASRAQVASATGLAIFAGVLLLTLILTSGRPPAPAAAELNSAAVSRRVLFHILHAVMWVFAIFLFDSLDDKRFTPWLMVVLYIASTAIMDAWLAAPWRKTHAPVE